MPEALGPLLEARPAQTRHLEMRANRHMSAITASLFQSDLNGPLRRLMMEGGVLQLLALQAAAASNVPSPPVTFGAFGARTRCRARGPAAAAGRHARSADAG